MDGQTFDRWARTIAGASSRRGLLTGLGALAAGLVAARAEEAAAARNCRGTPDGTRCGGCGVCAHGACVVDPTFHCDGCQRCSAPSFTCRPHDDRCSTCEACKQDGRTYRCQPLNCNERQRCCNHRCVPKDHCCADADCPECGRCEQGRCRPNPAKNGQQCGTTDCHVCKNGACVNQIDNAGCFNSNGLCCDGVCCAAGKSCCGHRCCTDHLCAGDVCCDLGFTAAEAQLCCPSGPPCGEGSAVHCCGENQHCCQGSGACCDAGAACCGNTCCLAGEHCCGDRCCPADRQCCDGVCCFPNEECCGDGVCRGQCGQCPDGQQVCETRPEFGDFFCCPDGAPCCPGNGSPYRCGTDPNGLCCDKDSVACQRECCPLDNKQCSGANFSDGTPHFVCCPFDQEGCYDFCCPVGTQCHLLEQDTPSCV
ncbi:MAG TPA: hypothetical protein VH482_21685 [Thermomicrobiales bacterium]